MGTQGIVEFFQGDLILDLGEDTKNDQVQFVVRAHAFGQTMHGGAGPHLTQGANRGMISSRSAA
jgi:hypothetical protein